MVVLQIKRSSICDVTSLLVATLNTGSIYYTENAGGGTLMAALDRMEWRKMTKMVTRRRLVGWSGER